MKNLFTFLFLLFSSGVFGQANFSNSGPSWTYNQSFNTLPTAASTPWVDNSSILGIYAQRSGTGTTIAGNNGSSNGGNLYSYGTGTTTERAIGSLGSGNAAAGNFVTGLRLSNNTGAPISTLTISYVGEQWRNSATAAQTVTFSYITSPTAFASVSLQPLLASPAGYTALSTLDFTSPITGGTAGTLDGDAAANRSLKTATITLSSPLATGGEIILRWHDPDHSGSDHGLSIDDVVISAGSNTSPSISVTSTSISGLSYVENNGPSATSSYGVSGINLTPLSDTIKIAAPLNFELSNTAIGTFSDTIKLPFINGALANTLLYVRLKTGLPLGNYGGMNTYIKHIGGGADSVKVSVSGSVNNGLACGNTSTIASVRATIPAQATYTGTAGVSITGSVTGIFGANKIYIQDSTGGIAIFFTNIVSTNGLVLGDIVRMTGTTARFNGEAQLGTLTCISKVSAGTVPTAKVFDANNPPVGINLNNFLSINEGSLIKIISANLLSIGTFVGSTNYTTATCNNQGGTEIRIDPTATNLIGSAIPTVTQDITALVGHFINTTGIDKLQIFPRQTSDFITSIIPCTISGGCGITTFVNNPNTLDVFNWNIEWLGHPTNGPSQSGINDATQILNATNVIKNANADVYLLQEICGYNVANPEDTTTAFGKILKGLNTTHGVNSFSGECSAAVSNSVADPNPQRVCFIYKNSVITKLSAVPMFENFTPSSYPPTGTPSQFWASGRKPFKFLAKTTIDNQLDTVLFVGLHAKAGSDVTSYNRRKFDVQAMYDTLQAEFADRKTIVLGDMNDDFDVSITAGQISSYIPFLYTNPNETVISGLRPSVFWNPISKVLSDANCASTASFPDYIDHQIISNELYGNVTSGLKYTAGSVSSFRPFIPNFANTTSDHYVTVSRFENVTNTGVCPQLLTLVSTADDYQTGTQLKQAASLNGKIVASNKISGTSRTTFSAKSVELKPGFKADTGTVFTAEIGGCN